MVQTLTDTQLKKLISDGSIISSHDLGVHIQPASIDIPCGATAYHIKHKFIPFSREVKYVAQRLCIEKIDLSQGANLYKGQTYLIKCLDLDLPKHLSGVVSPKSSIGRVDLRVRSINDNHYLYDTIAPGKNGELWLEVTPQSFNVRISEGIPLAQLRIVDEQNPSMLGTSNHNLLVDEQGNSVKGEVYRGRLVLTLDMSPGTVIGYEAKSTDTIIDLSRVGEYDPKHFFREIRLEERGDSKLPGKYILEKDRFYILSTRELVSIPPQYSLEMVSIDPKLGDLTVHYAGFFDPGFGYPKGANGVLEVRPHEVTTVYHGQPICMMECFQNAQEPEEVYGQYGNNYQFQRGARLSKYFYETK